MPKSAAEIALAKFEISFAKTFGEGVMRPAAQLPPYDVIPTGSIALDHAMGCGGYIRGRLTELWGPPSLGKTTLGLIAIAEAQKAVPDRLCALIDVEKTFDEDWAIAHGVDPTRLRLITPVTAEDAADQMKALIESDVFSLVELDSIGAMLPGKEAEKDAGDAVVGVGAKVVTRMVKIATNLATQHHVAVILINQIRCLKYDTLISTQRGLTRINDLCVGDVVSSGSSLTSVKAIVHSGVVHGVEVWAKHRGFLTLSDNHRQTVVDTDGNLTEKFGNEMMPGDWLVCPYYSPSVTSSSQSDVPAALLGAYFADGTLYDGEVKSYEPSGLYRLSFSERSDERFEICRKLMVDYFGELPRQHRTTTGVRVVLVNRREAVNNFASWGVGGHGKDKVIPEVIMQGSDELVAEFLRHASFDTHGFSDEGFIWTAECRSHLEGISALLRRWGIYADIRLDSTNKGGFWRLYITGNDAWLFSRHIGFAETTKQNASRNFREAFGARGKYDVVPNAIVNAIFSLLRTNNYTNITRLPNYNAFNQVMHKGLNGSRKRMIELCEVAVKNCAEIKRWIDMLDGNRFSEVVKVTPCEFDAYDIEVHGGRFVANGILTHNSNIGSFVGPDITRPGGHALQHCTTHVLKFRRGKQAPYFIGTDDDKVQVGHQIAILVEKNKVAPPKKTAMIDFFNQATEKYGAVGIDRAREAFQVGKRLNLLEQAGAYYTLPDTSKHKSEEATLTYLREHREVCDMIRTKALAKVADMVVTDPIQEG